MPNLQDNHPTASRESSSGERSSLRGYRWQYDHIASYVYDALLDGDFEALLLTDPDVGRVDDMILVRRGRTHAYQFKSVRFDRYLTFNDLLKPRRTRSVATAPSLLRDLADGWKSLRQRWPNAHVHLVTQQLASINDKLGANDAPDRPSPQHFSAFLTHVLEPIAFDVITVQRVSPGWQPALSAMQKASGLDNPDFYEFLSSLHIDVAAGSGLPHLSSIRRSDVMALSQMLLRHVSLATSSIELNQRELLNLMGWSSRPRLHSTHNFPVDIDTYQPLQLAIDHLNDTLARYDMGYVALVGPPRFRQIDLT